MYRADGNKVSTKDAMYEIVPYIMPKRFDASNSIKVDIDLETVADFVCNEAKEEGEGPFDPQDVFFVVQADLDYQEENA